MAAYQAKREQFKPRQAGAGFDRTPFWNRQLKEFNPFSVVTRESGWRMARYAKNYANHNLFRPKGILTMAALYGGSGWLFGVTHKQQYSLQYEYH